MLIADELSIERQGRCLCDRLSLRIQPGEIIGVLGPNGCGKTTLLHTLAGLHPPTRGQLFLHQQPLAKVPLKQRARSIGVLFQQSQPALPLTVWDFCKAARFPHANYFQQEHRDDHAILTRALRYMALEPLQHRLMQELSGGEQRRVAIAAVLTQDPALYVLDEPINHLDLRYQMSVLRHFRHLVETRNVSVILSLHDLNVAQRFCDRILLVFPHGRIEQGHTQNILTSETLSALYQYPIRAITQDDVPYWQPDLTEGIENNEH